MEGVSLRQGEHRACKRGEERVLEEDRLSQK